MDALLKDKLLVKNEDPENGMQHPHCNHGPTVLYYKRSEGATNGFYACSAYRSRKLCNFYQLARNFSKNNPINSAKCYCTVILTKRNMWLNNSTAHGKDYCLCCSEEVPEDSVGAHKNHRILHIFPKSKAVNVPALLSPVEDDKGQAQYFFTDETLNFFVMVFKSLKISRVICIGAPRLHTCLRRTVAANIPLSFLLDIDKRYLYFYKDDEFAWYNMCNHHFFFEAQKAKFYKFLQGSGDDRCLIFVDPPFGCRTELIANSLRQVTKAYNKVNGRLFSPLSTFWIFPYYFEEYIREQMPSMEMTDYKVNYTNHIVFSNDGNSRNRKLGSPVRLFTNLCHDLLRLPPDGYKFCKICRRYTALENVHCMKCNICPSRNGSTYRHCAYCALCVKPTYSHCHNCRRCTRMQNHLCVEFQLRQICWICENRGHIERNCPILQLKFLHLTVSSYSEKIEIICHLCGCEGLHNEKDCPKRQLLLSEITFMGKRIRDALF